MLYLTYGRVKQNHVEKHMLLSHYKIALEFHSCCVVDVGKMYII